MTERRRFGHIPDYPVLASESGSCRQEHAGSDWLFHEGPIAKTTPLFKATTCDWSPYLDAVQDQLGGTCVGQSASSAIYLRAKIAGVPIRRPSAPLIVAYAQMVEAPGRPIDCDGCQPSIAVREMRERGIVRSEEHTSELQSQR